jgi:hypothetical protein
MKKGAPNFMRLALFALLIQVVCPLFLSVRTPNSEFTISEVKYSLHISIAGSALHAEKHSVNAPALLKEKDETEGENHNYTVDLIPLIDFSDLSSVLSQFHNSKIIPFVFFDRIDHRPPLFALHNVYLI